MKVVVCFCVLGYKSNEVTYISYNNKRLHNSKMLHKLRIREICHKSKSKFYPKIIIKPSTSFESELYLRVFSF